MNRKKLSKELIILIHDNVKVLPACEDNSKPVLFISELGANKILNALWELGIDIPVEHEKCDFCRRPCGTDWCPTKN